MKFKPFRDYSEHDVVNLFSLDVATADAGLLVKVAGSGFINNRVHGIAHNLNPNIPNVFTPRWEVKAKLTAAGAGELPLGFTLYPVKEIGFEGKPLTYDSQRRNEAQCVVSGEAVPVVRKGLFLVQTPTGTGDLTPIPGRVAVAGASGQVAVAAAGASNAFGLFLGRPDADGYTLCAFDFNKAV